MSLIQNLKVQELIQAKIQINSWTFFIVSKTIQETGHQKITTSGH